MSSLPGPLGLVPDVVKPGLTAPRLLAPRLLAPRLLAPRLLAPRPLAPRLLAPGVFALASVLLLAACQKELVLQGTRFPVRAPLEASVPVEGEAEPVPPPDRPENRSVAIALPGMSANADWPQRGGSARHAGPHGALSAQPQLVWQAQVGAGNSRKNRISAAPVVAGGKVFAMDALAGVTAISVAGATLWHADLTASFDAGGGLSGGGLATDGARVYATTGYGEAVALDAATGAVIWRQRLGAQPAGAPTVAGNLVYVVGDDGTAWALNASTGRVVWTTTGAGAVSALYFDGGGSPAVDGALAVLPFSSGALLATDAATGTNQWNAAVSGQRLGRAYANVGDVTGDPVLSGGVMYVGTQGGRMAAISTANGQHLWSAGEGALNPPLVVGGSVFSVNDEGRLVRLDAQDGSVIWAVDLPYFTETKPKKQGEITANFGPVLAGGHVVVVSSDGYLRGFNATDGSLAVQAEIPGGAATPVALAQGMLFVVNQRGQLLAFR